MFLISTPVSCVISIVSMVTLAVIGHNGFQVEDYCDTMCEMAMSIAVFVEMHRPSRSIP